MSRHLRTMGIVLSLLLSLSGCKAEAPAFVGKWVEQASAGRTPHTLEISIDRGVYTVAETIPIIFRVLNADTGDTLCTVKRKV